MVGAVFIYPYKSKYCLLYKNTETNGGVLNVLVKVVFGIWVHALVDGVIVEVCCSITNSLL